MIGGQKISPYILFLCIVGRDKRCERPICLPAIVNIVERKNKNERYVSSSNLLSCLHCVCSHFARVQEIGREKLSMNEPMWYDVLNCLWRAMANNTCFNC